MLRERQVQALRGEFAECLRPGVNFDTVSWVDGWGFSAPNTRSQPGTGRCSEPPLLRPLLREEVHTRMCCRDRRLRSCKRSGLPATRPGAANESSGGMLSVFQSGGTAAWNRTQGPWRGVNA